MVEEDQGAGGLAVRAWSWAAGDPRRTPVSDGLWTWDPETWEIRGLFAASGMPFQLLEYRGRVEGDTLAAELRTVNGSGAVTPYRERSTRSMRAGRRGGLRSSSRAVSNVVRSSKDRPGLQR